jgi:hypothetical protein
VKVARKVVYVGLRVEHGNLKRRVSNSSVCLTCLSATPIESLVRGFLPAYSSFLQHLLKRTGKEQIATRSSLGGQPCNPQLAIVVTHPSGDVQNVQICPTPYGQSVIISYAEGGKWRLHEHWKAVKRSDSVVCERLELVEE